MAVKAHVLYSNPHLGKALMFSAVGHTVALMLLLVSPRWFPVPDTSASTMDAIEVVLFSAIVSGSAPPEHVSPPAREMTEVVRSSAAGPTRRAEAPKPESKPASPPPVAEPKTEKAAAPPPNVSQVAEATEPLPATVPVNEPDPIVPPKAEPVRAAKVDRVPAPDPKVPKVSVRESVNTLLDSIRAGMNVPEPMVPAAPLPEASKLAQLSDLPAVLPKTMESPEISERVQETVKKALKDVAVPAPLKRLVPIQEAQKLAKLADIPDVLPEAVKPSETKERVREVVKEALTEVAVPSPLEQLVPVPTRRRLAELPEGQVVLPKRESADAARTKEQVQAAVTRALEEVEIPSPMEASEPLDVASLPPSTSLLAPSVYSELKVIAERNEVMAGERIAARQGASDADSFGSPPMIQEDAQWEKAFAKYASRVKKVINRNWHWQGDNSLELRVMLRFRIYPDGRATRVAIAKTSGNQIFDRAAIRAVRQLKRLPRFPADIQREFLDVEMDFSKVKAS